MSWAQENDHHFKQTEIFQKLQNDFVHLSLEGEEYMPGITQSTNTIDPRASHRVQQLNEKKLAYSLFIYLALLQELNPSTIADIGCGANFVKKYIPNVIGFDATTPEADINEFFDKNFVDKHYKEFDCAFAICSLHYVPFTSLGETINDFAKIINTGGRGFVTINLGLMVDERKFMTLEDHRKLVDEQIDKIEHNILVYDNLIPNKVVPMCEDTYNTFKGADWPSYQNHLNEDMMSKEIAQEIYAVCNAEALYNVWNGNVRIVFEVN